MESSESDFSSYKRPYEQSDDDFPISKRQKRHQSCAHYRYQSSATDKHQSSAVDKPQRRGQTCYNNTEPDMSQDKEVQVPSAHEPS